MVILGKRENPLRLIFIKLNAQNLSAVMLSNAVKAYLPNTDFAFSHKPFYKNYRRLIMENIKELFANLPIEADTKIKKIEYYRFEKVNCRYEHWIWEGIAADSLIFLPSELRIFFGKKTITLEDVIEFAKNNLKIEINDSTTYKENEDYIFLNYNFYTF